MKELIDLYVKLLIGTFTFIGPSFTLLISLSYKQLGRSKKKYEDRWKILINLQSLGLQEQFKAFIDLYSESKRDTRLLNPKRQIRRLFGSLLAALTLVGFYYFQHTHFWTAEILWINIVTLGLSSFFYVYSLYVLWQIFGVILIAKKGEEESKQQNEQLQTVKTLQL